MKNKSKMLQGLESQRGERDRAPTPGFCQGFISAGVEPWEQEAAVGAEPLFTSASSALVCSPQLPARLEKS